MTLKSEVKIDGMAWLPKPAIPADILDQIRKDNTVRLKAGPYDDGPTKVEMFRERDFHLGIPRGFYQRTSNGKMPSVLDVTKETRDMITGVGPRDDMQRDGISTVTASLLEDTVAGSILCAATGVGKTVMGLLIAAELGYTTTVIVHKTNLLTQWIERIEEDPGVIPGARVGVFQGDREEFGDDYDIVVAMVQTLSNRDPDHPFFSWPGLVIVDECHRLGAPTFNEVIHHFKAAKRLGLTATPRRRDGGEQLFFDAIGPISWQGSAPMLTPKVRKVETSLAFKKDYPKWIEDKIIARNIPRNETIVRELTLARKKGRQILVLTKRLSQLLLIKKLAAEYVPETTFGVCTGSWYVDEDDAYSYLRDRSYQKKFRPEGVFNAKKVDGDIHDVNEQNKVTPKRRRLKTEQFEAGKDADVILATYGAVEEGFDVKRLDTLFLAAPTWDPEQATGRILRKADDKRDPIVVHFVDSQIPKLQAAWNACKKRYIDLGAPL